ncbi:MAG TPA: translation initiation factor IF-3 [Patescibacteria group bacterium]|nr:translation initiation factor IF-3 [Patescibacteria group bacterium]
MTCHLLAHLLQYRQPNKRGKEKNGIAKTTRLNEAIRATQLRVIDQDGKQLGILSKFEALQAAQERGLDLVEISPGADPPVAKIVEWGKFNYQKTKQLQKNKRNVKNLGVKQMRFGLKIGDHDLGVKLRKITDFLEAGHKVKITVFYRGRELAHKELGFNLAERVIESFGDTIAVDQLPQLAGKQLNFVIRANSSVKAAAKAIQEQSQSDKEHVTSTVTN